MAALPDNDRAKQMLADFKKRETDRKLVFAPPGVLNAARVSNRAALGQPGKKTGDQACLPALKPKLAEI